VDTSQILYDREDGRVVWFPGREASFFFFFFFLNANDICLLMSQCCCARAVSDPDCPRRIPQMSVELRDAVFNVKAPAPLASTDERGCSFQLCMHAQTAPGNMSISGRAPIAMLALQELLHLYPGQVPL